MAASKSYSHALELDPSNSAALTDVSLSFLLLLFLLLQFQYCLFVFIEGEKGLVTFPLKYDSLD